MRPRAAALAILCICASLMAGPAGAGRADSRQWPYYCFDDFETSVLRPRWLVRDTTVTLSGGRIHLTNPSDAAGIVALKPLYGFGEPKIYLYWPWAMETRIDGQAGASNSLSYNGGVTITFGEGSGWLSRLEAGVESLHGRAVVYYAVDGKPVTNCWTGGRLTSGGRLYLRVEGIGDDQQTIRIGAKEKESDPWVWSPEVRLGRPVRYAQPMALRNGPAAGGKGPGSQVTVSFDSVRFEGKSFAPGFFHRDSSEYLRNLSDERRKELKAAGLSVGYARGRVPKVDEPVPAGKRYKATVPDTLDIAERMVLSINAITEGVDRGADCEPYCHVFASPGGWTSSGSHYNPDMERKTPVFLHDFHGYNVGIGEGWVEDIPLLRLATGSTQNLKVSQMMFDNMRRMIGEDGLPCFPLEGRPWALFLAWWIDDPLTGRPLQNSDLTMSGEYAWGRFLSTLAAWYAATGRPELRTEIEKMVLAFDRLDKERPDMPQGMTTEYGVVQAYKATGFEPARELAARLLSRTRMRKFKPDGSFSGHFHGTTFSVLAMAELAAATNDQELLDFVKKAYEFAISKGWPAVGYYPEAVDQDPPNQETCSFTHLPKIAAILSLAGKGDYWDDIDCLVRNQMAENQLTDSRWIYKMAGAMPDFKTPTPAQYDGIRDVGKRLIGGFAGFASLNDYFKPVERAPGPIIGCCTGNGGRALYYVWRHILHTKDGGLYINLLLNRASKQADIDSYIPYQGRVDVKMKTSMLLFVRMPGWVDTGRVTCTVDGREQPLTWQGRYASPGAIAAGKVAVFEFPIQEKTVRLKIGDVDGTLVVRGNTVVDIMPKGKYCPLYQGREKYRAGKAGWKTVTRFVPDKTIDW